MIIKWYPWCQSICDFQYTYIYVSVDIFLLILHFHTWITYGVKIFYVLFYMKCFNSLSIIKCLHVLAKYLFLMIKI